MGELKRSKELFRELITRLKSGEVLDPESYYRTYPDLEEKLRRLFERFNDKTWIDRDDGPGPNAPNRVIDDFRIIKKIGEGGMGTVYEAEQISLHRKVALKILPSHLTFSSLAVKKFQREAEAGGRQRHPGVVSVYAVGVHEGAHYIAQELVEGGRTLADWLNELRAEKEPPPGYFREAADLTALVADALQHVHDAGVIHRDVKPSNILLTHEGLPKVTDFGLAKIEDALELSRTGEFAGTPYYMSPEQAMSRRIGIDHRTDVYSLGVTFYEMITLNRPFEGKTSHEILKKIILMDPVDPHKANPRVSRDLSTICLAAMDKVPEKRYQTMWDFAEDLRRFLSGDVIQAKPAGIRTRAWKRIKRNPIVSAMAGLILLLLVAVSVIVPWVIAQAERKNVVKLKEERMIAVAALEETKKERQKALDAMKDAEEQARIANQRYIKITRLSDMKELTDLEEEAEKLWPAAPEKVDELASWLDRADELFSHLDDHQVDLEDLRKEALPYGEAEEQHDIENRERHPRWQELVDLKSGMDALQKRIDRIEREEAGESGESGVLGKFMKGFKKKSSLENLKSSLDEVKKEITILEAVVKERRTWNFEDQEIAWWHEKLYELVDDLESFFRDRRGTADCVRTRFEFATTIEKRSVHDHRLAWNDTISAVANEPTCPHYRGLALTPQIGFVPLGPDPESDLFEFTHLQSGSVPQRDGRGALMLEEETGLVFVLIPGGTFTMGAELPSEDHPAGSPNVDPHAEKDEGPVRKVTIPPFFLSKYEMTQGQWQRVMGTNPSVYDTKYVLGGKRHTLLHPVENVNWYDCQKALIRFNLRLPSESEWEYGARSGTTSTWWTGKQKESLDGSVNLLDAFYKNNKGPPNDHYELWMNDGYMATAPVGCYRPNDFGLHDVCGNVYEWCQDFYLRNYLLSPSDGRPVEKHIKNIGTPNGILRGGSWYHDGRHCRSANRFSDELGHRDQLRGLRPACTLQKNSR